MMIRHGMRSLLEGAAIDTDCYAIDISGKERAMESIEPVWKNLFRLRQTKMMRGGTHRVFHCASFQTISCDNAHAPFLFANPSSCLSCDRQIQSRIHPKTKKTKRILFL